MKRFLFAFALIPVSLAQGGRKDRIISKMNVTDTCKDALRAVHKPSTSECSLPNRDTATLDKFCPNIEKCVEWAKGLLKDKCKDNLEQRRVKFIVEYGAKISYANTCLKDSKNEYCRIRMSDKSKCGECQPKFLETVRTIMKDAPTDEREKTLKWTEKRSPCNRKQGGDKRISSSGDSMMAHTLRAVMPAIAVAVYSLLK
jgi:hypothetical protein